MQNMQRGHVAVIAGIVVVVAVTSGIVGWLLAKNVQVAAPESGGTPQGRQQQAAVVPQSQPVNESKPVVKVGYDANVLKSAVVSAVDIALKSELAATKDPGSAKWDRRVDISSLDASLRAAKGKWYLGDAWEWIAWRQADGEWTVQVSLDGYDCKKLGTIPAEFNEFFHDSIHLPKGNLYCL